MDKQYLMLKKIEKEVNRINNGETEIFILEVNDTKILVTDFAEGIKQVLIKGGGLRIYGALEVDILVNNTKTNDIEIKEYKVELIREIDILLIQNANISMLYKLNISNHEANKINNYAE